jgi:trans-aconitate methyltransferase
MTSTDSSRLSEKAVSGFANAALYDAHRPSYPSEAVTTLLKAAAVDGVDGARLIDLAAGTGKFTELLSGRKECFNILAVEPHHEMREQLIRKTLSNVTVADGLSTSIPADDESVDAVFAAQVRAVFANSMCCGPVLWFVKAL